MYLHYYFDNAHCGQVDSDLVFNFPRANRTFVVIAHNQDKMDELEALKLVYGKNIPVFSVAAATRMFHERKMPHEVFITKKAGASLDWAKV